MQLDDSQHVMTADRSFVFYVIIRERWELIWFNLNWLIYNLYEYIERIVSAIVWRDSDLADAGNSSLPYKLIRFFLLAFCPHDDSDFIRTEDIHINYYEKIVGRQLSIAVVWTMWTKNEFLLSHNYTIYRQMDKVSVATR